MIFHTRFKFGAHHKNPVPEDFSALRLLVCIGKGLTFIVKHYLFLTRKIFQIVTAMDVEGTTGILLIYSMKSKTVFGQNCNLITKVGSST